MNLDNGFCNFRDENLDYGSMKTLSEWLDSIGLGHYIEKFIDKGLITPRNILKLDDQDFPSWLCPPFSLIFIQFIYL